MPLFASLGDQMEEPQSEGWLSLDEAAARLHVSRLRVREAIVAGVIPGRRDNRGFWRVSLDDATRVGERIAAIKIAAPQAVELLFDEVEEVTALLGERRAEVQKLTAIVERQQDLIERALRLAETDAAKPPSVPVDLFTAQSERSHALLDRALTDLQTRNADFVKVTGLLDRAMATATQLDAEAARQAAISKRQRALLDRAFAIAQAGLDRVSSGGRNRWFQLWRRRPGDAD